MNVLARAAELRAPSVDYVFRREVEALAAGPRREVRRLRFASSVSPSRQVLRGLPGNHLVTFAAMDAISESGHLDPSFEAELLSVYNGYTFFQEDDVLVAKITPSFENGKGALAKGLKNCVGFGTTELHVLRAGALMLPDYLYWITRTPEFRAYGQISMKGTAGQQRVTSTFVKDWPASCPSVSEQSAIAVFLRLRISAIDSLINECNRLTTYLIEKRTTFITNAVARGLNPEAHTKHSGNDWLGRIPAHWQVIRLKFAADIRISGVDKKSQENESPVRLCNYNDVYKNELIEEGLDFMQATANSTEIQRFQLKRGDVIITKDSETWDDIGVPAYVPAELDRVVCGYHLALVRPRSGLIGHYLFRQLLSRGVSEQLHVLANGVTRFGIGLHEIGQLSVLLPPATEQEAIIRFIEPIVSRIDRLSTAINRMKNVLAEKRASLISAAVTGKIDVRPEQKQ